MISQLLKKKRKCSMCKTATPEKKMTVIHYTASDGPGKFYICDQCRKEYLQGDQDIGRI
jgi:uncharacterized protein with PIN domain